MWFSKAFGGVIESHNQKLWAISRCNFAAGGGESVASLGVYRRDPRKHDDEPNLLPTLIAKAEAKQLAKAFKIAGRRRVAS
jgi:hypothetical protein